MEPEKSALVGLTEKYVRDAMSVKDGTLMIAHDFKHVDRVRKWALAIGGEEGYPDLEIVEITALLHDIGLVRITEDKDKKRQAHGPLGAEIAAKFLRDISDLSAEDIESVTYAIRYHSAPPEKIGEHIKTPGDRVKLLVIITDADQIDAMGAIGLIRACSSKYFLPDYDPENIKGRSWGLSTSKFLYKSGIHSVADVPPVGSIIEQINQQIRYYDGLHTRTAKKLARPLVEYMQDFVLELEKEISANISN